jgi:hypothetical protein
MIPSHVIANRQKPLTRLTVLLALAASLGCSSSALASIVILFPHNPGAPITPDLTGTLSVNPTTASPGSQVTIGLTLTNTAMVSEAVTLTISVRYQSPAGGSSLFFRIPVGTLSIAAGQTISPTLGFSVPWFMPPGTYTVGVSATDATGTISGSADLTITPPGS